MRMMQHTYIPISHVWVYNFMGGLAEHIEMDLKTLDEVYQLTADYIHHRHCFLQTHDRVAYNRYHTGLLDTLQRRYPLPATYFTFYWENLYRDVGFALKQLQGDISTITTICNDNGDMIGFVVSTP